MLIRKRLGAALAALALSGGLLFVEAGVAHASVTVTCGQDTIQAAVSANSAGTTYVLSDNCAYTVSYPINLQSGDTLEGATANNGSAPIVEPIAAQQKTDTPCTGACTDGWSTPTNNSGTYLGNCVDATGTNTPQGTVATGVTIIGPIEFTLCNRGVVTGDGWILEGPVHVPPPTLPLTFQNNIIGISVKGHDVQLLPNPSGGQGISTSHNDEFGLKGNSVDTADTNGTYANSTGNVRPTVSAWDSTNDGDVAPPGGQWADGAVNSSAMKLIGTQGDCGGSCPDGGMLITGNSITASSTTGGSCVSGADGNGIWLDDGANSTTTGVDPDNGTTIVKNTVTTSCGDGVRIETFDHVTVGGSSANANTITSSGTDGTGRQLEIINSDYVSSSHNKIGCSGTQGDRNQVLINYTHRPYPPTGTPSFYYTTTNDTVSSNTIKLLGTSTPEFAGYLGNSSAGTGDFANNAYTSNGYYGVEAVNANKHFKWAGTDGKTDPPTPNFFSTSPSWKGNGQDTSGSWTNGACP